MTEITFAETMAATARTLRSQPDEETTLHEDLALDQRYPLWSHHVVEQTGLRGIVSY